MLLSQGTILCQNVMVVKPIEYKLMIKLKNINLIYLKNKGKLNPIDSILCDFHRLFSFNRFWGLCELVYVHEERWKYFRKREVATETKSKENSNFLYDGGKISTLILDSNWEKIIIYTFILFTNAIYLTLSPLWISWQISRTFLNS